MWITMNQQILSPRETCTQHEHYSTWLLGFFFFLSRRTDYKHNYLVQCQIRSQILVIRLCDYRHLKNKVCRSVKHTCWWGHYLGVRYNLNHQKFLSVCFRFVTFQNSFFSSSYFSSFIQVWVQNILSMSQPSVPGASCSDLVTSIMAASGTCCPEWPMYFGQLLLCQSMQI